jgi:minor extracellular protease Epr
VSGRSRFAVYIIVVGALLACLLPAPGSGSSAHAQVGLPPIQDPLRRPLDRSLERVDRLGSRIGREVSETEEEIEEPVDELSQETDKSLDAADDTVQDVADPALDAATAAAAQGVVDTAGVLLRPFLLDVDPADWPIEKHVVVMLIEQSDAASRLPADLEIVSRRELDSLGLTLVTVRDPARPAAGILGDLRQARPDLTADFNHVYRYASDDTAAATPDEQAPSTRATPADGAALRVGMIDSAVQPDHMAFLDSRIVSRDFVTHEGDRPLGHGTAIASLIAASADNRAEILAASVFFQTSGYAPGATTESLVAALDWLAAQEVDAVNMSLAGPANALLEETLAAMAGEPVVVAAVGNNGPSGEPLYPAAYDDVIGVTAVDVEGNVFRYANRGDHVDYAALGVNVKAADSGGSWRLESGTSMASPHIAVVVSRMLQSERMALQALTSALAEHAEDLGETGRDPVFGYGLVREPPVRLSRN